MKICCLHPLISLFISFQSITAFYQRRWICQLQLLFAIITLLLCIYLGGLLLLVLYDCCIVCVLIYVVHTLLLIEVYGRYKRCYMTKLATE